MTTSASRSASASTRGFSFVALLAFALSIDAAPSASSTGRVTHVLDGAPIADVRVVLANRITHETVAETQTAPDGWYTFDDRPPGTYLVASREPYLSYGGYSAPESTVDIQLSLPAYFEGTLRDAGSGAPLQGRRVDLLRSNGTNLSFKLTDAAGYFRVGPVPQGSYHVCHFDSVDDLRDECYHDQHISRSEFAIASPTFIGSGQVIDGIDLDLDPTSTIRGQLFDRSTAAPLANETVSISLFTPEGRHLTSRSVLTDAWGNYVRRGVDPRPSLVVAGGLRYSTRLYDDVDCTGLSECPWTYGTPVDVPEEGNVDGIDFSLFPGSIIRGRVTDESTGEALPGLPLVVAYNGSLFPTVVARGLSGADGTYQIRHLLPGFGYWVFTDVQHTHQNERWTGEPCNKERCTTGPTIPLTRDDVRDGIDFALARGGAIGGQVRAGGEAVGARGRVEVFDSSGMRVWNGSTDAEGRYTTAVVPPGIYRATASHVAIPMQCVMYHARECVSTLHGATPIEMVTTAVQGIDLELPYALILRNDFE